MIKSFICLAPSVPVTLTDNDIAAINPIFHAPATNTHIIGITGLDFLEPGDHLEVQGVLNLNDLQLISAGEMQLVQVYTD